MIRHHHHHHHCCCSWSTSSLPGTWQPMHFILQNDPVGRFMCITWWTRTPGLKEGRDLPRALNDVRALPETGLTGVSEERPSDDPSWMLLEFCALLPCEIREGSLATFYSSGPALRALLPFLLELLFLLYSSPHPSPHSKAWVVSQIPTFWCLIACPWRGTKWYPLGSDKWNFTEVLWSGNLVSGSYCKLKWYNCMFYSRCN